MTKQKNVSTREVEIYLPHLFRTLLRKAWLMVLGGMLGAVILFFGTYFFVVPQYRSTAMFYVNNNAIFTGDFSSGDLSADGLSYSDISASKNLVYTYIAILDTRESVEAIIDDSGVDRSYEEVRDMISAAPVEDTEIFRVNVSSPDPVESQELANAIVRVLPKRIATIVEGSSAEVVETSVTAVSRSSPDYNKNAKVGFLAGALTAAMILATMYALDSVIYCEDDLTRFVSDPILTSVPDMKVSGKKETPQVVGSRISFAAAESYKLLRTKLEFAFSDEKNCHIIGVTSAAAGEGKSTTAANLAYSMASLGKKVLLIDCDMRLPSLNTKLPIRKMPGLAEFLSGQASGQDVLQTCGLEEEAGVFQVIVAGRTPPNPMELLSSARMTKMLETLSQRYDHMILDLPPVGEVGDALAAAKLVDGMLVVVRQNQSSRKELDVALRQLQFVDSRILGLVLNFAGERGSFYARFFRRGNTHSAPLWKGNLLNKQSEK